MTTGPDDPSHQTNYWSGGRAGYMNVSQEQKTITDAVAEMEKKMTEQMENHVKQYETMLSIVIGNPFRIKAVGNAAKCADVFDKSPEIDVAKALYGQFSGLLVKQGTGNTFSKVVVNLALKSSTLKCLDLVHHRGKLVTVIVIVGINSTYICSLTYQDLRIWIITLIGNGITRE